jgi:hypothetical protein
MRKNYDLRELIDAKNGPPLRKALESYRKDGWSDDAFDDFAGRVIKIEFRKAAEEVVEKNMRVAYVAATLSLLAVGLSVCGVRSSRASFVSLAIAVAGFGAMVSGFLCVLEAQGAEKIAREAPDAKGNKKVYKLAERSIQAIINGKQHPSLGMG